MPPVRGRARFAAEVVSPKFEAMSKFDRSFYESEEGLVDDTIRLSKDAMIFAIAIAILLGYAALTTLSSALHLRGGAGGAGDAGLGASKGQGRRGAQEQEREQSEGRQREPLLDHEQD